MTDEATFLVDRDRFFARVGYAISRWAYIDRSLFDFCRFALGTSDRMTAAIFHRNPTIGDHLNLTDTLLKLAMIHPRHLDKWRLIVDEINKLLPLRNELAHNPPVATGSMVLVIDQENPENSYLRDQKNWWEIQTEPTKLLRHKNGKQRSPIRITSEDIARYIDRLDRLETAVAALSWELLGRPRGVGPQVAAPIFPEELGSD